MTYEYGRTLQSNYREITANYLEEKTKISTLTYGSEVGTSTFTHDGTQSNSSGGIFIEDLTVVKHKISQEEAYVKIYGEATYWGNDSHKTVTLPEGTLTVPFLSKKRAFRDELNVIAYVLATLSEDSIGFDRDNDITGDSPFYFEVEGIGVW